MRARLEMDRRVHMRAVVGGELNLLDRPAFAIGQIFGAAPGSISKSCAAVSALLRYSIFGRMNG